MRHKAFEGKKVGHYVWFSGMRWTITRIGRKWVYTKGYIRGVHPVQRDFNIETAIPREAWWNGAPTCFATRDEMDAAVERQKDLDAFFPIVKSE